MTSETNVPVSRQINEICNKFETAIKIDGPQQMEDWLKQTDAEHREKLFRDLLKVELECIVSELTRKERRVSYEARFPNFINIIRDVCCSEMNPEQIDGYEIIEELGRGGMGVVYKGKQPHLDQLVAIKVLPQELLKDPQAIVRFQREMKLIGPLAHPNIVRAHNSDGSGFLAMEYVDGVNLQQFVKELAEQDKRIPLGAICEIVCQTSRGLQHAHESRIVHRDIKPVNLMLDFSGTVKILDFGIGKFRSENIAEDFHDTTKSGEGMGTRDYMAPEQSHAAKDADIRADIFSLGCTFCFLATGYPPYFPEKRFRISEKQIEGDKPSIRGVFRAPDCELEKLDVILRVMLAKNWEQRIQTPQELVDVLEPFADSDQLYYLLEDWKRERDSDADDSSTGNSQTCIEGGRSTHRMSAKNTIRRIARPQTVVLSSPYRTRNLWGILIFAVVVSLGLGTYAVPYLLNLISTAQVPETTSGDNDPVELAKLNIAQLPGLNGCWWFEEIPWFIPPVRELLIRRLEGNYIKLDKLPDFFIPNVSRVNELLWKDIIEPNLNQDNLQLEQIQLVNALRKISSEAANSSNANKERLIADFTRAKDTFVEGRAPISATDLHTLANLYHRIAVLKEDESSAKEALKYYDDARKAYKDNAYKEPRLEILCHGDRLRIKYALDTNEVIETPDKCEPKYKDLFEEFDDVCKNPNLLSPLFEAEFRATYGELATEAGLFDRAEPQFAKANKSLQKANLLTQHDVITAQLRQRSLPLQAHINERHAWSLMNRWSVGDAHQKFDTALKSRKDYHEASENIQDWFYIQHNEHGIAMTLRYGCVDAKSAQEKYKLVIDDIDKKIEDPNNQLDKQLQTRLNERAGNTSERLADCTFYGGVRLKQFRLDDDLVEAARLYGDAMRYYEPESMKQVMQLKQAIMLMLCDKESLVEEGEDIYKKVIEEIENEKNKNPQEANNNGRLILYGNQHRINLLSQLAKAVFELKNNNSLCFLYQLLNEFPYPTNPNPNPTMRMAEAGRRENLEIRLFAAELLLHNLLERGETHLATLNCRHIDFALWSLQENCSDIQKDLPFTERFFELQKTVRDSTKPLLPEHHE